MKKLLAVVVAGMFAFSFTGFAMAKDKAAHKPKVVKECKKDGTKCTAEEMKDKKLKKECLYPCPAEPSDPAPPAGQASPPAPPAGQ